MSASSRNIRWAVLFFVGLGLAGLFAPQRILATAQAETLSALARLDPAGSQISRQEEDLLIELKISQSVPWRVRLLADPPRMVLDVREVDWTGLERISRQSGGAVTDLRAGVFRPGWSRLVLALNGPWEVTRSQMRTGDMGALIQLQLSPTRPEVFAMQAQLPEPEEWALPMVQAAPRKALPSDGPIVVVLDPGHGGIDPGAERDGEREADLVLTFARELKELLLRDGRFRVVMTRDDDVFVPLESRISVARAAQAHVFLSLHADALSEGEAQGATIYTLSDEATNAAAEALAERHERDDILAGIDLSAQDDMVAKVLMDMARTETEPRTTRFALRLEAAITAAELKMHRKPRQEGGFSVLKSPDIPSVLLELGFLSSSRDLKRLMDAEWRGKMADAIRLALLAWAEEDQALRGIGKN